MKSASIQPSIPTCAPAHRGPRTRLLRGAFFALVACLAAALLSIQGAAAAPQHDDSWKRQRFKISVGVFWPRINTTLRIDSPSSGLPGTTIDIEDDLGLQDREALGLGSFYWRMARKHALDLSYFDLPRSGTTTLRANIQWGDTLFSAGALVESHFDTEIIRLSYYYTPFIGEKSAFFFGGGLNVMDISFGITDRNAPALSESNSLTAPLPVVGLGYDYAFLPKWRLGLAAEFFAIKIQGIEGGLLNAGIEISWHTWDHVGFNFGYKYFDVALEGDTADLQGIAEYTYSGPMFQVAFTW